MSIRETLCARKRMMDGVRTFFDQRGFLEVETPIAVRSPGLEPHLDAFETEAHRPDGRVERLFLHTSPEYAMKRLLGQGSGSIYQIARVFRNGERSNTHAPEFTMLEWYRSSGHLFDIATDVEELMLHVSQAVGGPWRPSRTERISVSDAFVRAGLVDPLCHPDRDDFLERLRTHTHLALGDATEDTWDDLFFRAFLSCVEPTFPSDAITILHGYPASMAALACIDPMDPRRAQRFEVYVGALELGNAFQELLDPGEQRARFEEDLRVRAALSKAAYPIDEDLLIDLPQIPDPTAGIAVGLDRLLMCCLQTERVQDVIPFSPVD